MFFLLFAGYAPAIAQTTADWKADADAIVHQYDMAVDVHSPSKVSVSWTIKYEVLNKQGAKKASFAVVNDSYRSLDRFQASISDANGQVVGEYALSDLVDESYISGYSLFEDNRIKYLEPSLPGSYPYTITFKYRQLYKSAFYLPDFMPARTWGIAVEEARLSLQDNDKVSVKYRPSNCGNLKPVRNLEGKTHFVLKNRPANVHADLAPPFYQVAPRIELVPTHFAMDKTKGSFGSWETFGQWISNLNKGRGVLPPALRTAFRDSLGQTQDPREKARIAYEFLQANTRYVSVQMGIGGFRPYSAAEVSRVGYGDCKALSNFTVALLKEAGLDAHYTLIYSGSNNRLTSPDFPASAFNHAIVCLPLEEDTIWLECTSQVLPFDFLPSSTSNRYALAINGDRSKLVRTPKTPADQSMLHTKVFCAPTPDRKVRFELEETATGLFLPSYCQLNRSSKKLQEQWIEKTYLDTHTELESMDLGVVGKQAVLKVAFDREKVGIPAGKLLFVPRKARVSEDLMGSLPNPEERKLPVFVKQDRTFAESWTVACPAGYQFSRVPADVVLENEYGSMEMQFTEAVGKLECELRLTLLGGVYPAETAQAYNDLVEVWDGFKSGKWVFEKKS